MEFGLLGPLVVRGDDGGVVQIGAPKQRALLILLLLRVGKTVPVDRLIDGLWGHDPPPQARVTLRSYVSNLRRLLGTDQPVIVTNGSDYALQVDPANVDAVRFQRLVTGAREALAAGQPQAALAGFDGALGLWRGQALADLGDSDAARGERAWLEELRLSAQEDRFDALLALGRHGEAVAALEAFTAAEPLRERGRAQLMLGLYRAGRAPDALAVYQQFRDVLVEELGLDPSPTLQALFERILNRASDLDLPRPAAVADGRKFGTDTAAPARRLVGRVHECGVLLRAVERLAAGAGGLLLVSGEPGIGKSAMLEELGRLAVAAGVAVHWGRCVEAGGAPAFWPWIQVLRGIAHGYSDDELRRLASGAAEPVTGIVDDIAQRVDERPLVAGEDLQAARFRVYDAIATFLLRASAQQPLVLLLDDIHWADTPSLQTLAFVSPLLEAGSLLVCATYRDVRAEWTAELESTLATLVREPCTEQLGLVGLQPTAVAELAAGVTGRPVDGEELALLHERTGGNPFFVRQVSQLLRDTGSPGDEPAVPAGVRHVIARRLRPLSASVRALLETAAVLGGGFDLRRLAAAGGTTLEAAMEAAGHASAHGLIEAVGRSPTSYAFAHALVRETIYEALPPHRAAQLHAGVGTALEQLPQTHAAELADHFWRAAALVDDDRPVRHLLAAADDALSVLAWEQAETFLRRALQVLAGRELDPAVELGARARLLQLLIGVHGWGSTLVAEVAAPARALAQAAGRRPELLPLWWGLFGVSTARGEYQIARAMARQLLADADASGDPTALTAGHLATAYIDLTLGGEPAEAAEHVAQAKRHLPRAAHPHLVAIPERLEVDAAFLEALALASGGDAAAAIKAARDTIAVGEEIGEPFPQTFSHMVAGYVGMLADDPTFTAAVAGAGLTLCERFGFKLLGSIIGGADSWARARLGEDPSTHAARMWEAVEAARRVGHVDAQGKYLVYAAETYLLAGDRHSAARCLDEARALSARTGEFLPPGRVHLIEAALTGIAKPG